MILPTSAKYRSPRDPQVHQNPVPERTAIHSFSANSRRRLRLTSINAFPRLISQFGLTYHAEWPEDGRECKRHLDRWLTVLRRTLPGVAYLWILEFQRRGAPHFHVFLSVEPSPEVQRKLAAAWCRIAPSTPEMLAFHEHSENWIKWDMGAGHYLTKYLEKSAQKCVPDHFLNVGRFWGNSRGIVPEGIFVADEDLDSACSQVDTETGEVKDGSKLVRRWLGKLHEKQTRGKSRLRQSGSYTMPVGAQAYRQIETYLANLNRHPSPPKKVPIPQPCPF